MKKIFLHKLLLLLIAVGVGAVAIVISSKLEDEKSGNIPGPNLSQGQAERDLTVKPDVARNNQSNVREQQDGKIVFDVTLHTADEIRTLLKRAEELSRSVPRGDDVASIALVLHGDEIRYFTKENREQYRDIVDLARKLDQEGIIDIKMCRTMMKYLGIGAEDMPDFIEFVPFGPDEVQRLQREGYTIYL